MLRRACVYTVELKSFYVLTSVVVDMILYSYTSSSEDEFDSGHKMSVEVED